MTARSPHFMYVLVAPGPGYFAEMAAVSATTLKRVTPNARITFITDEATAALETPATAILRDLASDWIAHPTGDFSPAMSSRLLKLSSRSLVKGDVVFLDCDTLVAKDLTPLANHRGEFAVVEDKPEMPDHIRDYAQKSGLSIPARYFNSGVMGMRDTPSVHAAVGGALETWRASMGDGFYFDQVFLNSALHRSGLEIEWLPPAFNAQIWAKTYHAIRPRLFHVFAEDFENRNETVLHVMAKGLKQNGAIDEEELARFLETGNPWTELSRPGQYIALARPASAVASTLRLVLRGKL
ncbi:glycosyltransferase [Marinicaulis aureus]|uniref:Glycosyltransferase n=1 Tax=Hyphococcus aureus TaxID=2666033 RepID=A0ABW1KYE5_9PROT